MASNNVEDTTPPAPAPAGPSPTPPTPPPIFPLSPKRPKPKVHLTAFAFFCHERKETHSQFRQLSLPEMARSIEVRTQWAALSHRDRDRYNRAADEHNNDMFAINSYAPEDWDMTGRFDSFGRSLKAVHLDKLMKEYLRQTMENDIFDRITHGRLRAKLVEHRFHFLHVNIWSDSDDMTRPAEIAVVQFSIKRGISVVYSEKVCADVIPLGAKGRIKDCALSNHLLWIDHPDLCNHYSAIITTLKRILKPKPTEEPLGTLGARRYDADAIESGDEKAAKAGFVHLVREERERRRVTGADKLLPLYVMSEDRERVALALKWMALQTRKKKKNRPPFEFVLYDLPTLYDQLSHISSYGECDLNRGLAEEVLKRTVVPITVELACSHHNRLNATSCAASAALNFTFTFLAKACVNLKVPFLPKRHVPSHEVDNTHMLRRGFGERSQRINDPRVFYDPKKLLEEKKLREDKKEAKMRKLGRDYIRKPKEKRQPVCKVHLMSGNLFLKRGMRRKLRNPDELKTNLKKTVPQPSK